MRLTAIHLVVLLQILVQALHGAPNAIVICVPLGDCCQHDEEPAPHPESPHAEVDCHCHLRVPLPGQPKLVSRDQSRVDALDAATAAPCTLDTSTDLRLVSSRMVRARERPPDFAASEQVLALRSTHLRL